MSSGCSAGSIFILLISDLYPLHMYKEVSLKALKHTRIYKIHRKRYKLCIDAVDSTMENNQCHSQQLPWAITSVPSSTSICTDVNALLLLYVLLLGVGKAAVTYNYVFSQYV